MLSAFLHFINVPNGRCGVEVPTETADYNQSIFCFWSPTMEWVSGNQGNYSFEGSAFSNHTELQEIVQSVLDRKDLAEAVITLDHLLEDIPVPYRKNEREKLLKNEIPVQ